jgi:hypothetical protein
VAGRSPDAARQHRLLRSPNAPQEAISPFGPVSQRAIVSANRGECFVVVSACPRPRLARVPVQPTGIGEQHVVLRRVKNSFTVMRGSGAPFTAPMAGRTAIG